MIYEISASLRERERESLPRGISEASIPPGRELRVKFFRMILEDFIFVLVFRIEKSYFALAIPNFLSIKLILLFKSPYCFIFISAISSSMLKSRRSI